MYAAHPPYFPGHSAAASLPGVLQPGSFISHFPAHPQQHLAAAAMMQQQQQQMQHQAMMQAMQQQQQQQAAAVYPGSLYSPFAHLPHPQHPQPQPAFLSSPALQLQHQPQPLPAACQPQPQQPLPFAMQMSQMVQPQPPQQLLRVPSMKAASLLAAASPAQQSVPSLLSSTPPPLASASPPPPSSAASAGSPSVTVRPQYTVPPHLRPHPPAFPLPMLQSDVTPSSPPAAPSSAASSPAAQGKEPQQAICLNASSHPVSSSSAAAAQPSSAASSSPPNGVRKLRARARDSEQEGGSWRRSSSRERNGHTAASASSSAQADESSSFAPPLRHPPLLHAHSAHVASSHHKASLSSLLSSSSRVPPPLTQMQSLPITASRPGVSWRDYDADWTLEEREAVREQVGRLLSSLCPSYDALLNLAAAVDEEAVYSAACSSLEYRKMGVELDGWISGSLRQRRELEREEKEEQDKATTEAMDDGAGLQASADGLLALAQLSHVTAAAASGIKAEPAETTQQQDTAAGSENGGVAITAVSRGRPQRQAVSRGKAALSRRSPRRERPPRAELQLHAS